MKNYMPVSRKFWISHCMASLWLMFSIWISIPWLTSLGEVITIVLASIIIAGIAYIPGYLNGFMLVSLLLDKQPKLKFEHKREPITIIIACWNEEKKLGLTLLKIAEQNYLGRINVIIVDNNSTDQTSHVAKEVGVEQQLNLLVIKEDKPGKHHALNAALPYVKTKYLITVDADTLLHRSAIKALVSRIKTAPANVCAVAGAVMVRNSRENILTKIQEWDYFLGIASIKRLQGLYQGTLVVQGAFSLYKTDVLRDVGGWPDAIGEDIVVTWRILEKGWRVYFEPQAIAFTEVPNSFYHFARQRSRWARGMIEQIVSAAFPFKFFKLVGVRR